MQKETKKKVKKPAAGSIEPTLNHLKQLHDERKRIIARLELIQLKSGNHVLKRIIRDEKIEITKLHYKIWLLENPVKATI